MQAWRGTKLALGGTRRKKSMAPYLIKSYIMLRCRPMKNEKEVKCVIKDSETPQMDTEVRKKKTLIQPSRFFRQKLQVLMISQYPLPPC